MPRRSSIPLPEKGSTTPCCPAAAGRHAAQPRAARQRVPPIAGRCDVSWASISPRRRCFPGCLAPPTSSTRGSRSCQPRHGRDGRARRGRAGSRNAATLADVAALSGGPRAGVAHGVRRLLRHGGIASSSYSGDETRRQKRQRFSYCPPPHRSTASDAAPVSPRHRSARSLTPRRRATRPPSARSTTAASPASAASWPAGSRAARSTTSSTRPSCAPGARCSSSAGRAPTRSPGSLVIARNLAADYWSLARNRRELAAEDPAIFAQVAPPARSRRHRHRPRRGRAPARRAADPPAGPAPVPRTALPWRAFGTRNRRRHGPSGRRRPLPATAGASLARRRRPSGFRRQDS